MNPVRKQIVQELEAMLGKAPLRRTSLEEEEGKAAAKELFSRMPKLKLRNLNVSFHVNWFVLKQLLGNSSAGFPS